MPVRFQNFQYSYENERGKRIFVPTRKGYEIGYKIKQLIEDAATFEDFFFHFQRGGHVAALHEHRKNKYFARVDIKNFFYSISLNRVARVLREIGVPMAGFYAKFSCVKNPYLEPSYALPYGFVQSPVLATLVLSHSILGDFLRSARSAVTVSVYVDDIAISASDHCTLQQCFEELKMRVVEANFSLNTDKTSPPASSMELFNCELEVERTAVTATRRDEFYSRTTSSTGLEAFENYCRSVEAGNER